MIRDYTIVSPSLDGVLNHESLVYDGVQRPVELLRVLDSPARRGTNRVLNDEERRSLETYFQDLYGIFMKKVACFAVSGEVVSDEELKMQAMLQELFKLRKMLINKGILEIVK